MFNRDEPHVSIAMANRDEALAKWGESLGGECQGRGVSIEPQQAAVGRGTGQDGCGVPAGAKRAVDEGATRLWVEESQNFPQKYG